jgi:hypothetical protein
MPIRGGEGGFAVEGRMDGEELLEVGWNRGEGGTIVVRDIVVYREVD